MMGCAFWSQESMQLSNQKGIGELSEKTRNQHPEASVGMTTAQNLVNSENPTSTKKTG
jgi:hypothetical protein